MAEIVLMAEEELRKRGKADAAELAAQVVAGGVTDQELLEQKTKVPTWRAGTSAISRQVPPISLRG